MLISRKDLAKLLQVAVRTIDRYRELGMPSIILPTGTVRFETDEVLKWLKSKEDNQWYLM